MELSGKMFTELLFRSSVSTRSFPLISLWFRNQQNCSFVADIYSKKQIIYILRTKEWHVAMTE